MKRLSFWWWGEDEAPGLAGWVARTCLAFEHAHPHLDLAIETRLLRHDRVLTAFPNAVKAGNGPDLQFFWNGIYHMESAWAGAIAPLNDLIAADELAAIGGGPQSTFDGRVYRAAWYVIPVIWVANRAVLDAAGIHALPHSWDEFWDACSRVRAAGFEPVTAGDGEGDFSVWWLTHILTQAMDHPSEVLELVLGIRDWRDDRYHAHWVLLDRVRKAGFLDADALPLTLWDGLKRFCLGQSAFTLASGPMFPACRRALGEDVAVMVAPVFGNGHLAGQPIVDTQGIGISAASREPELAAQLLVFMHDEERRRSLYDDVRLFPADARWNGDAVIADGELGTMWRWYARGPNVPYIPNLVPLELHFSICADLGRRVLAGELSGRQAGAAAANRSREWREANDARLEQYRRWVTDPTGHR